MTELTKTILKLTKEGLSRKQIAVQLGRSESSVVTDIQRYIKLYVIFKGKKYCFNCTCRHPATKEIFGYKSGTEDLNTKCTHTRNLRRRNLRIIKASIETSRYKI